METRTLAFVIDGSVVSVATFDERTASIFLSNPTIVDITTTSVSQGWNYDPQKGLYAEIDGEEVIIDPR